jgi:hypothetical protein
MWPRSTVPDDDVGFVTARLDTVMRRYGFVADPVLWQIVIFVGGVLVGDGVTVGDGHEAVPTTTASPVWRRCPRSSLPERELGLLTARLETVIRRQGLASEPVLWQIVIWVGDAVACGAASRLSAAAARPANVTVIAVRTAMTSRFIIFVPPLLSPDLSRLGVASAAPSPVFAVSLQLFLSNSLTSCRG